MQLRLAGKTYALNISLSVFCETLQGILLCCLTFF